MRLQIAIDCADPAGLAPFWAAALEYEVQPPPEGFDSWRDALLSWGVPEEDHNKANAIVDPTGVGPRVYFQQVPEPKTGKNRLHLDVSVSDGPGTPPDVRVAQQKPKVDQLVALGASVVGVVEEMGAAWHVLQDPEGNEFCVT